MMSLPSLTQIQPIVQGPNVRLSTDGTNNKLKDKVVIVLGATGTGKSKLSISLADTFSGEVLNSDKMQIYKGLDIVTNKITKEESCGIPHHLLSVIEPNVEFTATNFCNLTLLSLQSITEKGNLPIIAGGSNSYIEALVDDQENVFRSRYDFCCLWVDVSIPVLNKTLSDRVDRMLERGLLDEVREMFDPNVDYSKGIWRSIGVPELDHYFRDEKRLDKESRERVLVEAINNIKTNTHKLALKQVEKIHRNLKSWKIHRLDATAMFRGQGKEREDVWKKAVMEPSNKIVDEFLNNRGD
ncbi:hypothetical protein Leryth_019777 [Lithospermum erythrorhizon]|nr:hypothetical protein Leryth_019777 [Lithospermum erythrorhizon]